MRIKTIEVLGDSPSAADGAVVLLQKFSGRRRHFRAVVMIGCGVFLSLPLSAILVDAAARAHLGGLMTSDPTAVAQLAIVCLLAVAALVCGIVDVLRPIVSKRIIRLEANRVTVEDTVRGRALRWHEPVEAYRGIRHQTVTTSGGTVQTLSLEHPRSSRSLCIAYETHVSNQAMLDAAGRYQLPLLPTGSVSLRDRVTDVLSRWLSGWGEVADSDSRVAST